MKRLATILSAVALSMGSALAQGTIDFHNANTYPILVTDGATTNKLGATGSQLGPASVRVQLFIGADTATSLSQLTAVGMTTNSPSTSTLFQGTFNGGNPFTIPGTTWPQGTVVAYAFAAWSNLGAQTWADAVAAGIGYGGVSMIGHGYALSGGPTPPGATFGTGTGQIQGFVLSPLVPVPEPSTFALAGLGLAGLLAFRRRK